MDVMLGLGLITVLFLSLAFILYVFKGRKEIKSGIESVNKSDLADYELFFTVNIDMLCIADVNGYFLKLNPEWERTLGYQLPELIGKRFLDFVHPDDIESTIKATNDLANNKVILNFENRYKHKDGSYRWIEWRSYPVNNKIYAAARDITSRKMADEEMQKTDLWLRESQKNSHIGSYNFNISEGKWKSSAELDAIFGIPSDYEKDILGWTHIIHPDEAGDMLDYLLNHVIKNQQPFNKEYRIICQKSGEERWVHGMGNLYYNKEGILEYMIGTIQDITDKKNVQDALIKGEERYRLLFENMTSGFALHEMIYDKDGEPIDFRYLDVNQKYLELWDVKDDIKGKTFNQLFPSAPDEWFRVISKVVATKEPFRVVRYFPEKNKHVEVLNFWAGSNQFAALFNDITERVNAENALRESESQLRSFINESSEGVVIINEQGVIDEWNNKATEITGIPVKNARNKFWLDTIKSIYPQKQVLGYEYDHITETVKRILQTGILELPAKNIHSINLPNGEVKYIEQALFTFKTNVGYRLGVIFNDITERKRTEEALNQERVITDAILAGVPGLMYMYNEASLLVRWNKKHETATGYNAEELSRMHLHDWFKDSPSDIDTIKNAMARLNTDGFASAEAYLQKKNGEKTFYYFTAVPTVLNGKNYFLGIGIDLTDKKKAEELITYERNMLRALIDNITDIVYVKDTESRFLIANKTLTRILGTEMENMLGKTDLDLFPSELATDFYNDEKKIFETGIPLINKEELVYDYEGNVTLFQTNKVPLRNPQGNIIGLVGTGHIITEQKRAENEIKKLNEELEKKVEERTLKLQELNRELESFAYSVSHDLRAPLRHVDGFVRLMYSNISSPSDSIKSYFEKISNASRHMSAMIDELLKFSRLGRKELTFSPVNLDVMVNEIIDQLRPDISNRNITWKINPLPVVSGDRNLLRIVFDNLISNAIKYTSKIKDAIIEFGIASEEAGKVTIYIKDNGAGFDMAYAEKLFGVFQRLHSPEEFEGIGIGLANVKQIVMKHKGSISAEGKIDEGATFYIILPK